MISMQLILLRQVLSISMKRDTSQFQLILL